MLRHGLCAGYVGRYLTHEFVKVAQALQPANDYLVIDLDVVGTSTLRKPTAFRIELAS